MPSLIFVFSLITFHYLNKPHLLPASSLFLLHSLRQKATQSWGRPPQPPHLSTAGTASFKCHAGSRVSLTLAYLQGALSVLCSRFSSAYLVVFLRDAVLSSPAVRKEIAKPSLLFPLAASSCRKAQLGIMKWAPPPASFIITRWTFRARSSFSAPGLSEFCFLGQHRVWFSFVLSRGAGGTQQLSFQARRSTPGAKSILFFVCATQLLSFSGRYQCGFQEMVRKQIQNPRDRWAGHRKMGRSSRMIRTWSRKIFHGIISVNVTTSPMHMPWHSFLIEADYNTWVWFLYWMTWVFPTKYLLYYSLVKGLPLLVWILSTLILYKQRPQ